MLSIPTAQEFKDLFPFPYKDFSEPIIWTNGIGFSLTKDYGEGNASLYKIGVASEDLDTRTQRARLWLSVSYGKVTEGGILLGTREGDLWSPIDLNSLDEFFYDVNTHKFYYRNQKEIEALDIFTFLEDTHLKPTKLGKGFILRLRLWLWRKFLPFFIKIFDFILISVLWVISGERIKGDIWKRLFSVYDERKDKKIEPKDNLLYESKTIDFFGYKAKRWSVVFYSVLHLGLFVFFYFEKLDHKFLTTMLANNLLALCYVVVSFSITESLIPKMLRAIIGQVNPRVFNSVASKRLKI